MTGQDVMPGMIWHRTGRDGGDIVTVQPVHRRGRVHFLPSCDGDRDELAQAVLDVEKKAAELWPPDRRPR
ncbi:hypothetical protein PACID_15620 [Acidipropionibacterium acidipropionici ATCC 4875]|uniref:Uncharacterized protein n=1 Tax=Acidipropionibacterium acidipropionici (strain ATCC 4875 / DSM 20272 / JCM 6432 / NBRC 12425 / NCIMB 8070 / 4) TaxID=1171373 RepID=K7SJE8_ACIA4|nr:hypothetical protein [Acidipropionibacterium acidipropionici]AFV89375.1 hypothetical protein PACID_15620 [Acidipropionibacterium acidipropionici ATCC 4875]